jgi:hypothetical protein
MKLFAKVEDDRHLVDLTLEGLEDGDDREHEQRDGNDPADHRHHPCDPGGDAYREGLHRVRTRVVLRLVGVDQQRDEGDGPEQVAQDREKLRRPVGLASCPG